MDKLTTGMAPAGYVNGRAKQFMEPWAAAFPELNTSERSGDFTEASFYDLNSSRFDEGWTSSSTFVWDSQPQSNSSGANPKAVTGAWARSVVTRKSTALKDKEDELIATLLENRLVCSVRHLFMHAHKIGFAFFHFLPFYF